MAEHVVSFILHVRGASNSFSDAYRKAVSRLKDATESIKNDKAVIDPGADFRVLDPGGGGPCVPSIRTQDFDVSDSGLPEARSRDD